MLQKYNNKLVKITDIDNQMFSGRCLYENREDFEEEFDGLSVKTDSGWIKLLENEIKSIEILD
ncbi:hypothetical protein [Finegoldia magna]|jgi:hypothetical protein|uniref:hypothetical protein n=1 Tax=Finegoldia magna TaxID=1260 RepID=UPI000D71BBD5|nr:hypothetical protein [Finegoldia magna]MCC3309470.1 hypothetical protein [Finegoldia magna]MCC3310194.1 hypothetical protein [Finegoldia magna]MDU4017910.1 hypothetical protein [Finegoldia magna]PWV49947.1 hypothetical protein DES33_10876 [Finegoldia magna]